MARIVPTIPAAVLERLSDETRAAVLDERTTRAGTFPVEVRSFNGVETRDNADGTWEIRGYASSYDYGYPIAGGPENGGWTEVMARGAADVAVRGGDDVRLLFDHGFIPLARTKSGTLELRSDDLGIMAVAPSLDRGSPYAQSIRSAVERGDADQMSVAFRVTSQEWNDDYTVRTITGVSLFDVSIVTYPANEATIVQTNSATRQGERRALLDGMTYSDLQSLLTDEVKEQFGQGSNYLWVCDFTDSWLVYYIETDSETERYQVDYSVKPDGSVTFSGEPMAVDVKTTYVPEPAEPEQTSAKGMSLDYALALSI